MASGNAGSYFRLLQQFDQKAQQQPTSDNVQIQKVAVPTDSVTLDDGDTVTWSVGGRPALYGQAKYGQAEYGS